MSTVAPNYKIVLDPKAYEGIHLLETDGEPMDSIWHRDCMFLLIAVVTHCFRAHPDFFVGGNNFIYFNPDQARNLDYRGPDFFFMKDGVDRARERLYWAVWLEGGRVPDVVIELLSPTTQHEDHTTKFTIYERTLRIPEYFLYDPETQTLEGYRLSRRRYRPLEPNERGWLWSKEMGLWLGKWEGEYLLHRDVWLRCYTPEGELALLPDEEERLRADAEKRRADAEKQRAEAAEQEVARLRALLGQQGQKPNGAGGAVS